MLHLLFQEIGNWRHYLRKCLRKVLFLTPSEVISRIDIRIILESKRHVTLKASIFVQSVHLLRVFCIWSQKSWLQNLPSPKYTLLFPPQKTKCLMLRNKSDSRFRSWVQESGRTPRCYPDSNWWDWDPFNLTVQHCKLDFGCDSSYGRVRVDVHWYPSIGETLSNLRPASASEIDCVEEESRGNADFRRPDTRRHSCCIRLQTTTGNWT